ERLLTIRETVTEQLGNGGMPEMEQLLKTVNTVASACQSTDLSSLIPQLASSSTAEPTPQSAPQSADWHTVQLSSRADAQLMLEKVKHYFFRHEPSHPAPLMIERVQRMVELDFMEIIRDLAPDGVHQLETLFGRRDS
ncbi:ImpA family type VI secretion system protein, partial [Enterobacter cloacae complex sp. CARB60]